ncbi:heavy metal translocating P-type ATPase [Bacillus rubiinfantis]|uniref:heavy metal translocating P-type ATPase n=1 Tax=Bacillus rubiinfantis TaxID=1499680 RepID=UPI0005AABBF9|nr:cation-translocating P-type ATPase [Bacillus rubiinfantis]
MELVMQQHKQKLTIISGFLIAMAFMTSFLGHDYLKTPAFLIATVVAGVPIFVNAYKALRMKVFSIELLVTIAVIGALFIHEYTESAVVTFLFLLGDFLEAKTLEKTRSSLKKLIEMAPQEATVVRDEMEIIVPIEEIRSGDHVIIRSGGKVPVDGQIVTGQASIIEAAVTGEAVPTAKSEEDKVYSGTIVDQGYIEVIAEKVGDDTTFAKIIELVDEAQESKSKTEKFLDQFATFYTPAVVLLAIIVLVVTKNFHLAITFLVVACPGALVIGAPVSNVAGIGNGAKNGVLVKGSEVMNKLAKVDTLVFDKTGTLTKGKPAVIDIKTFADWQPTRLLQLVAGAEMISEHHLGQTIVKEAKARKLELSDRLESGEIIKGNGITGKIAGHALVVGNRKLLEREGIQVTAEALEYAVSRERTGNTVIFVAVDGSLTGLISIADQIREDAHQALTEMRKNGIRKIVMLTGDNQYTAELVARQLGIDDYHAELLPEDKVEYVKKLKAAGYVVAMAGDGINDAPAIATADIGLAMGEGGTDVSMETADVVLMADKLMQFSHAYKLAKATISNMKQNTFFAVAIVIVLLIGVLVQSVQLASGMFIHEASVLLVIVNAMRLIHFGRKKREQGGQTVLLEENKMV